MTPGREKRTSTELRAGICHAGSPLHPTGEHPGDIELNFVVSGEIGRCSIRRELIIPSNRLAVFSSAFAPLSRPPQGNTSYLWVQVSVESFLSWRISTAFKRAILGGELIMDLSDERAALDRSLVLSWVQDVNRTVSGHLPWTLLEIEARMGRLIQTCDPICSKVPSLSGSNRNPSATAARLAAFLLEHYAEPIHWQEVARVAGSCPAPARQYFQRFYGMTPHQYLVKLRLARAKQLITDDHARIIDIALETGFPTVSNFYRAFEAEVGQTPSAFRKALGQKPL